MECSQGYWIRNEVCGDSFLALFRFPCTGGSRVSTPESAHDGDTIKCEYKLIFVFRRWLGGGVALEETYTVNV